MRRRTVRRALVAVSFLLCAAVAEGQVARSQFNGTVTDSAGGVLVGATVVATNVETNVESKATTTDAGVYVLPYLPNGVYRIRVQASGFRPAEANDVTLRAAQTLTLSVRGPQGSSTMTLWWVEPARWQSLLAEAGFEVLECYGWFDWRPFAGGEDSVWIARRK